MFRPWNSRLQRKPAETLKMFKIPNLDGKSVIPVFIQTKAPIKQEFTIYEDETATKDNSTQDEDEEWGDEVSISHIEDLAGVHVQLMQYHHGYSMMAFILPLAQEIDEKLGSTFVLKCEAFEEESLHREATLSSNRESLRKCICVEEAKEELHRLRDQVLKDASFAEELLGLMTEIIQKKNEAQLQGHKFKGARIQQVLPSSAEIIAGYILDRGRGAHREEGHDEKYFESLEKSWARIFHLQYAWDMEKFRAESAAKMWAHYMHEVLLDQPCVEKESIERWVWLYGTRVLGAEITEFVLFGDALNVERNKDEWLPLVDENPSL